MPAQVHRMDSGDQETLFQSYPCAYYVQSPSTISHANSADIKTNNNIIESTFHSPTRSDTILINKNPEVSRFTLSRYSSSRGSNNSFLIEKKVSEPENNEVNRLIIVDGHGFNGDGGYEEEGMEEDEDFYYDKRGGWWWRYCSFRRSSSCAWVSLQVFWRLVLSLCVALLVFYAATKPPPPKTSIKGSKLYAQSHGSTLFQLFVGTRNKPMYGAGTNMQDMLESENGLPIVIRVSFRSNFRVVWNLIKPEFHHRAVCLLVLDDAYDKKHRTQVYNSTCTMS
ncbi:hypothetical protein NC653_002875 [Populus alba x Populus x berolinensis]|uniref:Uncharacterized protein n=1 Tax=Populus alba x Populus x berolinensis TaxID=444605 RepID=A0AAD6RPZ3_9ROSI|nr:hypothetical protein NC653_002875 [Populus alba x Populus x berolinensis]